MVGRGKGFTLIELLVVIAIIAILAAILFPVFARAKQTAMRSSCSQNMKQINLALLAYTDDNGGRFPNASYFCRGMAKMWGVSEDGPFMVDLLDKYIKNGGVWICPAVKPDQKLPDWGSTKVPFSPVQSGGGLKGHLVNTPSNYMWNHIAHGDKGMMKQISGKPVSEVVRPTRAMTFIEMPYWTDQCPHSSNDGRGVNIVFYDGHVMYYRKQKNIDAFYEWSWRGWYKGPQ